ncbi:MAG: DEAD/DEAH box helicase family protein, partial [Clostridia bacterium]
GSGKTLTSFKAAQILSNNPKIYKVIFLVDRIDLNRQTIEEFKGFLGVDSNDLEETENSNVLARQLVDKTTKIIVTTIQKLHNVLINDISNFYSKNKELFMQNFIFIIDECHRTQFGDMHKKIRKTFLKSRLIGFTGTPIFAKNQKNSMTTGEIFGLILHKYMMFNAIRDCNVLKFIIEYIGYSGKQIVVNEDNAFAQINDINELSKTDEYYRKIVDYIIQINTQKTKNNTYKSMLVCSDIPSAIKYY